MPAELPSANQIPTPASATKDTLSTNSNILDATPVVEEAGATGTSPNDLNDLILAETLRDCLTSLPQSSLISPPPELNDNSQLSPSLSPEQADPAYEPESEVVQIAKLLRRTLYIMARLGDPLGVYQSSPSENNMSFAVGNNVTEILRDSLYAVMALQTMVDQQNALEADSPNPGSSSNPRALSTPNAVEADSSNLESSSNQKASSTANHQTTPLTLGRLMGNETGPPWGNEVMKPLCEALYTEPFDENSAKFLSIAASYDTLCICDKGIKTPDDYINRIRCYYKNVLYGVWVLFGWPLWIPDSGSTFKNKIDVIFPPLPKRKQPSSFSVTLADIFAVGLEITSTIFPHEHLLITGNEVKILCLSGDNMKPLQKFHTNRAAIALGIGSLGAEIFASLYALYGRKKEFARARSLNLLPNYDQQQAEFFLAINFELHAVTNKTKPQVLASRLVALNNLTRHRRSPMVSLIRDMRANKLEQPLCSGELLGLSFLAYAQLYKPLQLSGLSSLHW
ncbi:hypothetical protein GGX14DRAFT_676472 [Mycena pura]|uniref:Uncharacterized protein n=1 Tax=Mycena pura TaxID=153505 RepID=A0AAD6VS24_9AGAR|nr:hypothetical protein GGX14DRAFT_676472 [Mycena pura]